jgi:peptidoglycan/LPS O-acetylase OafA/YrhL
LESLRGLAAIIVAISHLHINSFLHNDFTRNSGLMVDFFFLLSGFVISLNYQDKIITLRDIIFFQIKRFFRLYPLHIFMLLLFVLLEIGKYFAEQYVGLNFNNQSFSSSSLDNFVKNIFLLHGFYEDGVSWNGPSWSISNEFFTYIIFAFLVLFLRRSALKISLISVFIILLAAYFLFFDIVFSSFFARCLLSFFLGVVVFNFKNYFKYKIFNPLSYLLLIMAIYMVCNSYAIKSYLLTYLIFALFLFSLVKSDKGNLIKKALNNRFCIFLGTISYSIYLIHYFLWILYINGLKLFFGFKSSYNDIEYLDLVIDNNMHANIIMLVGIFFLVIFSSFTYRYIEVYFNFASKK